MIGKGMTRLLLDIGNTRIKWALQTDAGLGAQQAIAHAGLDAGYLATHVFKPLGAITRVLVSNVAGHELAEQVRQATRECWQLEPQFFSSPANTTVAGTVLRNAYAEHAKLGVDRWFALVGAYAQQPSAALVVSIGTAMTLDALTAQGQHLGGMIVPGPALMMHSLMRGTSDIEARAAQGEYGEAFFADNTLGCVYQGAQHATLALIVAAHTRLVATAPHARLLLTGGAAPHISAQLSLPHQLIPDLVLQGLATV